MSQKKLEHYLKALIIGTALCGLLIYLVIMPHCLREMFPDSRTSRAIWMAFLLPALIPCYRVLSYGWQIAGRIGADHSFCTENALALKRISLLAALDTAYVLLTQTVFLPLGLSRATVAMFALVLVFIGIAISTAAIALAHLVEKAAKLQEENDATV